MTPPVLLLLAYNTARTHYAPLFAWPIGPGRYVSQRTSPYRPSEKFSLMEFSEIRVRQDSYSPLYEP
jgi:hypothetical protein